MKKPVHMTEGDLVEMMKLNFHLIAEIFAELAERNPEKRMVKLHSTVNGFRIGCALMATEQNTPDATE